MSEPLILPFMWEGQGQELACPVRVLQRDLDPWFLASDVCKILELRNPWDAISSLEDDEKVTLGNSEGNPRAGIPHSQNWISESGLYSLVFRSRKPQARTFRKWVTGVVLPKIRRSGFYINRVGWSQMKADQQPKELDWVPVLTGVVKVLERLMERLDSIPSIPVVSEKPCYLDDFPKAAKVPRGLSTRQWHHKKTRRMIDRVLGEERKEWIGTAHEMLDEAVRRSRVPWHPRMDYLEPKKLGAGLAALAARYPDEVEKEGIYANTIIWHIKRVK